MKLADLDMNKVYTYADYCSWKFEERIELIKGYIFKMSPGPNRLHQELLGKLHLKFGNFLYRKSCQVFMAPFDVRFPRRSKEDKDIITVLQPDMFVVCDQEKLDERGCIGAPDIVIEILSPSNNRKELKNKYEIYEESGVKEYWVVMPYEKALTIYTLTAGQFVPSRLLGSGDVVTSDILPGFSLDLTELFESYVTEDYLGYAAAR